MMTEVGVVTGYEGGFTRVEVPRTAHCAMCSSKEVCGRGDDTGPMVLLVEDPFNAPIGASVEVGVPGGAVARGALLVYGLPVAVLVTMLAAMELLGVAEGPGVVAGIVAAGIMLWLGGRISRRGGCRPVIVRIVPPSVS